MKKCVSFVLALALMLALAACGGTARRVMLPPSWRIRFQVRSTTAMPELSIKVSSPRSRKVFAGRCCSNSRSMESIRFFAA